MTQNTNTQSDILSPVTSVSATAETSPNAVTPEIVGNAGFQGNSAGKSAGNDREIPANPGFPNATATSPAQNVAVSKVDRSSVAMSRLNNWAGETTLGDLKRDGEEFVIDLCEKHTYAEVVEILALPRPVGLNLKTSISSLQRFYAYYRAGDMEEQAEVAREQIEIILADKADNDESFYKAAKHLLKRRLLETSISPVGKSEEICRLFGMLERIRLTDLAERRLTLDEQKAEEVGQ